MGGCPYHGACGSHDTASIFSSHHTSPRAATLWWGRWSRYQAQPVRTLRAGCEQCIPFLPGSSTADVWGLCYCVCRVGLSNLKADKSAINPTSFRSCLKDAQRWWPIPQQKDKEAARWNLTYRKNVRTKEWKRKLREFELMTHTFEFESFTSICCAKASTSKQVTDSDEQAWNRYPPKQCFGRLRRWARGRWHLSSPAHFLRDKHLAKLAA